MSDQVIASPPAADGEQGLGAVTAAMDTPVPAPATPSPTPQAPAQEQPAPGDDTDWKARYTGASRVIAERDKQLQALQAQLDALKGEVSSAATQLQTTKVEADAKAVTLQQQLEALTGEKTSLTSSLADAQAQIAKYEALKAHPELLPLADAIPNLADPDALQKYIEMISSGVTQIADDRVRQLTAGITPGAIAPADQYAGNNSLDDWQSALNDAAGTDKFAEVAAAFRKWEAKSKG